MAKNFLRIKNKIMTEQNLIDKIEWVNKRSSLRDEPLTRNQKELLMFVFADNVVKNISSKPMLEDSSFCVVCGEKYKNPKKDSDTCYDCREPHAK